MKEHEVIVGEFENELYAEIARRDLRKVGINANINKSDRGFFFTLLSHTDGIQLIVPDTQVEEARKILKIRFM